MGDVVGEFKIHGRLGLGWGSELLGQWAQLPPQHADMVGSFNPELDLSAAALNHFDDYRVTNLNHLILLACEDQHGMSPCGE